LGSQNDFSLQFVRVALNNRLNGEFDTFYEITTYYLSRLSVALAHASRETRLGRGGLAASQAPVPGGWMGECGAQVQPMRLDALAIPPLGCVVSAVRMDWAALGAGA
jgi:hypothetical protein